MNRNNLLFVIEDETKNKFGYFLSPKVTKYNCWIATGSKSFLFTLERNGRHQQPMKYESIENTGIWLHDKSHDDLCSLGNCYDDINLKKKERRNECYNLQSEEYFNYHDIEKAVNGKEGFDDIYTLERLVVIQMI